MTTNQLMTREQMEVYREGLEHGWNVCVALVEKQFHKEFPELRNSPAAEIIQLGEALEVESPNQPQGIQRTKSPEVCERPAYLRKIGR